MTIFQVIRSYFFALPITLINCALAALPTWFCWNHVVPYLLPLPELSLGRTFLLLWLLSCLRGVKFVIAPKNGGPGLTYGGGEAK